MVVLVSARATYLAVVLLGGALGVALWVWATLWVYRDARRRHTDPRVWTAVAALLGFVGVVVWLVARDNVAPIARGRAAPPARSPPAAYGTASCRSCGAVVPYGSADAARTWMTCAKCGARVTVAPPAARGP